MNAVFVLFESITHKYIDGLLIIFRRAILHMKTIRLSCISIVYAFYSNVLQMYRYFFPMLTSSVTEKSRQISNLYCHILYILFDTQDNNHRLLQQYILKDGQAHNTTLAMLRIMGRGVCEYVLIFLPILGRFLLELIVFSSLL